MNVLWVMGPSDSSWNGVSRYSLAIIEELNNRSDVEIEVASIPFRSRTLQRYIYQFFLYPFILALRLRKFDAMVLYQEDLSFLTLLAKLLRKPIVIVFHHLPEAQHAGQRRSLVEVFKSFYVSNILFFLRFATKVVVPSCQTKNGLVNFGIKAEKLSVVYNGFYFFSKPEMFRKELLIKELGLKIDSDAFVFLNIGTDETRKNLMIFLKAFSNLDQNKFAFIKVGRSIVPSNLAALKDYAKQNGLNVKFLEYLSDSEINKIYSVADCYVSPSVHEGFGRTVIEAQSQGVPVLASQIPVYDETMGDSYYPVEHYVSSKDWLDAINGIVNHGDKLKVKGLENYRRFSIRNTSEGFYHLLTEVQNGRGLE